MGRVGEGQAPLPACQPVPLRPAPRIDAARRSTNPPACPPAGQRLQPDCGVALEFGTHSAHGSGSATYVHAAAAAAGGGSSFDVQQRFQIVRGLALEVRLWLRRPRRCALVCVWAAGWEDWRLGRRSAARFLADCSRTVLHTTALHRTALHCRCAAMCACPRPRPATRRARRRGSSSWCWGRARCMCTSPKSMPWCMCDHPPPRHSMPALIGGRPSAYVLGKTPSSRTRIVFHIT